MKLTSRQLRNIIEQEVKHLKSSGDDTQRFLHGSDSGHPMDDEGYMVKSRMASMKKMAQELCDLLEDEDQLPAWVQDLLATSHNDLKHVHDYMMGDEVMRGKETSPRVVMSMESKSRRKSTLREAHSRITPDEMRAWMKGDWGFVDSDKTDDD